MSNKALIKATSLNRFYGLYHAVDDFNLTLHQGEVLGLLGPNGAGKSTTMQMLTGNISPSSGDIIINGIDLIEEPQQAKQSIGYLPEQPPVYRDMTPQEFLGYCALLHKIPKEKIAPYLVSVVERCGLADVKNKLIGNLSKGFQQRVGIAQAIIHKPDVVILDEPTVGLDPIQITQIRDLIRELGKDHSVILSTHILPEVQAVCDRVLIINQGKTVFADDFSQLSEKQESNKIVVGFKSKIEGKALKKLSTLDAVVEVITLDEESNRFQLRYSQSPKPSEVFQLAVQQGWELTELRSESETLEQIFMKLIHSDSHENLINENESKMLKTGGGV